MWALAIARVRRSPIRCCLATWFSLSMAALPSPASTLHLNVTLRGTDAANNSLGTTRFNSTPSTSLRSTAMTCAACRCPCARPTSPACWRAGRTVSSLRRSSRARSDLICFAPPATWDWRDWCRSAATGPIRAAGRSNWVKVKNRKHPAMSRVMEAFA